MYYKFNIGTRVITLGLLGTCVILHNLKLEHNIILYSIFD